MTKMSGCSESRAVMPPGPAEIVWVSSIINKTWIVDANGQRLSQLNVNFTFAEIVGHAVIWLILVIVTLGLALIVYYYMVMKRC